MKHLLKSATVIQKSSPFHKKTVDILIENGTIQDIKSNIEDSEAITIQSDSLHVSSGWIDLNANFCEPGQEHKEDLESGSKAAAAGGFTKVCLIPNTKPVLDNRSQVEFIKKFCQNKVVELLPIGSLSQSAKGEELSEMYDMWTSGAVGFSDGYNVIHNPNLFHRALRYTQSFGARVFHFAFDNRLSETGVMNEGEKSTNLGLQGIPEICEDIMVARDIELLKHAGGQLHFSTISSKNAIEKIKSAKKEGFAVSCDIPSYLLYFEENDLEDYDSHLKVLPPLRSKENRTYYINAINEGTIDAISSNHQPQAIEDKAKEFDHAAFGMINIQTSFSSILTQNHTTIELDKIIETLTSGPEEILGIKPSKIEVGTVANLTIFDPTIDYILGEKDLKSKSKNSPFIGQSLKGKILGIINDRETTLH